MIEINLLPQEFRKKKSPASGAGFHGIDINNMPLLKVAAGIVAAIVFLQVAAMAVGMISRAQLSSAARSYDALSAQKAGADALKEKVSDINKRSAAIDELIVKRFSWARKMSLLSDCVTPGVWLSELYYDERPIPGRAAAVMPGALVISGYASGSGEQGAALIGKFIRSLQENKDFYADFASIDLVSSKSDKVDNQDVMSFRISCVFK